MSGQTELWQYYVEVGIWPRRTRLDSIGWLKNFKPDEAALATRLLQGFTYFSRDIVEQMFWSATSNLSQTVVTQKGNHIAAKSEWSRFLSGARIVRVTGEVPQDTDSAFIFSRFARDALDFSESQILGPQEALGDLIAKPYGSVIFVDDFVGSGNQFVETWQRSYTSHGSPTSFSSLASSVNPLIDFFYCPLLCTSVGYDYIVKNCPTVKLLPAHLLDKRYSVLDPDSLVWRDDMKSEGPDFVRKASERAGIPYRDGDVGCWTGFHGLGLAIAFDHGFPDATIPLLYWSEGGWKPLLKKRAI